MIGPIRICWNYFFYHPATLENGIGRLGKFLLTTSCRPGCLGSGKARRNQTCELGALTPASVSAVICCADKERNHELYHSYLSPYARRVLIVLAEKGLEYKSHKHKFA